MTANNSFVCPVCDTPSMQVFVSIPQVPVHANLLWSAREDALNAAKGDVELGYCHSCGHIYNIAFDPATMQYTQAYENSLHFSPRFQAYAEDLAQGLIDRYDLHDKDIVETGSGQGDFLRLLCDLGDNRGWGFDSAYVASQADLQDERLTFVQGFDWWKYIDQAPDMFYTRHVLEHIETPQEFVNVIREKIGERPDTLVFFEMPNMAYTLRALAIWDIIYEHCSYYNAQSLACLFSRAGFKVLRTDETYAGQFLTIEAYPAETNAAAVGDCGTAEDLSVITAQVDAFAAEFKQKVTDWQTHLASWQRDGKKVVAWGAGSKGVSFLNILKTQNQIEYIIDINPRKEGKFVVGSGQQIVPPAFLAEYQPDIVILMNPIYKDEIRGMMEDMGVTAEYFVA